MDKVNEYLSYRLSYDISFVILYNVRNDEDDFMNKKLLTIDQMKHLKELGLHIEECNASCSYSIHRPSNTVVEILWGFKEDTNDVLFDVIPAFTLQDVFDLLPACIECFGKKYYIEIDIIVDVMCIGDKWLIIEYKSLVDGDIIKRSTDDIFIDAAYEMLCWCIEKGYVKVK